jgi:HlyD family secretion protein
VLKWLIVIVILAGGAGGGVWYWKHPRNVQPDYRSTPVTRGEIVQAVTATGQLNPVVNVQVGSQVSGNINKLYVDYNSVVTNGQLVAQLDPTLFKAARDQAKGDLESAKAALELSQVEDRRQDELFVAQLISTSDHDKAIADLHQSKANVMIKEAALEQAQANLDHTSIFAPIDGIVISRNVDVGQTVAASMSAPTIFVIANDLSKMQIDAAVSEADVGGVTEGQKVEFTVDAFPTRTFKGTVTQVRNAAQTNQNVVTYDTVIAVNNQDLKLRPGMTASVTIIVSEREDVLKIPNAALRFKPPQSPGATPGWTNPPPVLAAAARDGGASGRVGVGQTGAGTDRPRGEKAPPTHTVYLLAQAVSQGADPPPTAEAVQVKTGISDGAFTEITEGLKEGDMVITGLNSLFAPSQNTPNPLGGGFRRF